MRKSLKHNTLIIDSTRERPYLALFDGKKNLWKEYLKKIAPGQFNYWQILINKKKYFPVQKILVVTGPGSFTGVRTAVNIANAFGYAWNIPVLGVSWKTLEKFKLSLIQYLITQNSQQKTFKLKDRAVPFYTHKPY